MIKLKYCVSFVFVLLISQCVVAQEVDDSVANTFADPVQCEIDSIKALIVPGISDSTQAAYYSEIAFISSCVDTTLKYAKLSLSLCKNTDSMLVASNNDFIAWAYYVSGNPTEALQYNMKCINYLKKMGRANDLAFSYIRNARIYETLNYNDSIFFYLGKALDIQIRQQDTAGIAWCYSILGDVYFNKNYYQSACEYYLKAVQLDSINGNTISMAMNSIGVGVTLLYNKADTLHWVDNLAKAQDWFRRSVVLLDNSNNRNNVDAIFSYNDSYRCLAKTFIELAKIYGEKSYADSCLKYYMMAENYFKLEHTATYIGMSTIYADYLIFNQKYQEASKFMQGVEKYIDSGTSKKNLLDYYSKLEEIYELTTDYKNAYSTLKKIYALSSELVNDSTLIMMANAKTEYYSMAEKIRHENAEKLHQEEERRLRMFLFFVLTFSIMIFVVFWNKRKVNHKLSQQNEILNNQKSEIESQRDEIEHQKNKIEHQQNNIISSIVYAERIQRAAVSSESDVSNLFPQNFVYYRPRDIVSGDYYCAIKCGRYSVMVTADCTGHGIPGAFLSMLGISSLKEFMSKESDAENPGTVLDRMRNFIKATLVSTSSNYIGDGMDMTICCFDFDNMKLHYAIANQTLELVRAGNIIRLRGDNMPVARYILEKEHFKTMTLDIEKNDIFYMFSDGIEDQLGGEIINGTGSKLLLRNLEEILLEISSYPIDTQKQLLNAKVEEWRGSIAQVDDMTMVAIKV